MQKVIRRFNRYELKYLLKFNEYRALIKDFSGYLNLDSNDKNGNGYRISSLYYDSNDLANYRNKMDGIKYRRKLRLRTYKDGDKSLGFVEIKQRINRTVQKRRIVLPYEKALALCGGTDIETAELDALDQQTASEVLFLVKSMLQKPQCIISYHRKAYEGSRFDHGLRVTFDTHLKYRLHDLNLHSKSEDRFFLPPDTIVMEVKANEKIPLWLSSMLSAHQCGLERVSKYCLGMSTGLRHRENSRITY